MAFFAFRCPQCPYFRSCWPSRMRPYDWVPWMLFLQPYRCENCYCRFYVWLPPWKSKEPLMETQEQSDIADPGKERTK